MINSKCGQLVKIMQRCDGQRPAIHNICCSNSEYDL